MKRFSGIISLISMLSILGPVGLASASDGCGFGKKFANSTQESCVISRWEETRYNDGFENYLSIELEADTDTSINAESYNSLSMRCQKNKLHLYISMDGYIDTTDFKFTPNGSLVEYGNLAMKIDNGKVLNWGWKRSFGNQIELNSPERLISSLAKAKEKFSFKIAREDAPSIIIYPKADLVKYRKQFGLLGCKY